MYSEVNPGLVFGNPGLVFENPEPPLLYRSQTGGERDYSRSKSQAAAHAILSKYDTLHPAPCTLHPEP